MCARRYIYVCVGLGSFFPLVVSFSSARNIAYLRFSGLFFRSSTIFSPFGKPVLKRGTDRGLRFSRGSRA